MPGLTRLSTWLLGGALLSWTTLGGALAQEEDLAGKLSIELNATAESGQNGGQACTLTFLVTNGYEADIESLVYETVLFDSAGQVRRLTLFDFGALPVGRPRVRQFAVPDSGCAGLGRVLFNGVHACRAEGLDDAACAAGLVVATRTPIEVLR